ncbi:Uncharacterized protein APZ42_017907 [Daphnia magna]|uniref:Uncharacterized protein n=1 Tax=Daphnia magna TaxID=35525 RepID=A0A164ZEW2_9CRUS|nr:Uncharacterized protein APZ42_017907 [Daphnia magna]
MYSLPPIFTASGIRLFTCDSSLAFDSFSIFFFFFFFISRFWPLPPTPPPRFSLSFGFVRLLFNITFFYFIF